MSGPVTHRPAQDRLLADSQRIDLRGRRTTEMVALARRLERGVALIGRQATLLGKRRLVRIPMAAVTDEFAFALTDTGWHHFTALLADYDADPARTISSSSFARFFEDPAVNAVRDLNDLFDLGSENRPFDELPRFWLGTYPWGGLLAADIGIAGPSFGVAHDRSTGADTKDLWGRGRNLWYQPDDRFTIENEWSLTIELYRSIQRRYSPLRSRGFPVVTMLERQDGERRAVIVDGHHRLAVLAHLGAKKVTVEVEATVRRSEVDSWFAVRSGLCTASEALPFFDAFFELDGSERYEGVTDRGWRP